MFVGELRPYQDAAVDRMTERGSLLMAYDQGTGKEQPMSEPVLTPKGWRPIGDLRPGDYVIGRDGRPTQVLGVFPQGVKPVYEVRMSDGSSTRAGGEHLWHVMTHNQRRRGQYSVLTTRELLDAGLRNNQGDRKFRLPMVEPIRYPVKQLPLDPYLLGVLIGDGYIKYSTGFSTADPEILAEVERLAPPGVVVKHAENYDYRIAKVSGRTNPVASALRELGLFGKGSEGKFIPYDYMLADLDSRVALLQGLLDTDGSIDTRGCVEFSTVSRQLAEDFRDLVRSLGGNIRSIVTKKTTGRDSYRLHPSLPNEITPFRLQRKQERWRPKTEYPPTRIIDSIDLVGEEESVCIYVAAKDHLYVTKDYIVTHNTVCAIAASEELMGEGEVTTTLIVALSSLKLQWAEALADFTDLRKRWIKIKDQYIRVPAEDQCVMLDGNPEKRAKLYRQIEETQPEYIIATYDQIIDDWQHIRRLDVQCIIIDEATQIKTFKADRTKKIKRLWAPYRFALTGTPVENGKLEEIFSIMEWVDPEVFGRWDLFDKAYLERAKGGWIVKYKNLDEFYQVLSEAMARKTATDPDVAAYMPKVEFSERLVQLDFPTRRAYRRIAADLTQELEQARKKFRGSFDLAAYYSGGKQPDEKSTQGRIMARMLAAQMLLDHPDLLKKSAADFEESELLRQQGVEKSNWPGSKYAYQVVRDGLLDNVIRAPKLEAVVEEIRNILEQAPDHKVVVFCVFRDFAALLQQELAEYGSVAFHGQLTPQAKAASKQKFLTDAQCRIFAASDAGGYGLDLPVASHLINVDYASSAGAQDQRNTRHRRTSSEWPVIYVTDFLVEGTLEERKKSQLGLKRRVASAALDRRGAGKNGEIENDVESLTNHLARTAA